jgi:UDP-glucose 4-epimerase
LRHLITGGAGFIGSHLADRLMARGDEVTILDDLSTGSRANIEAVLAGRAQLVTESTHNAAVVDELMRSADACFHLASSVGVKLIVEQPLDSVIRTVRGTDTVMAAAARYRTRLLFTSTSEVYGKSGGRALREQDDRVFGAATTSRWSYATAKVFGEALAYGYTRERGARMTVARLFNVVGARQAGAYGMVLPRFVRQALAGDDLTVYGSGDQTRCFTHVDDAVDALLSLIESDRAFGNVYNVGAAEPVAIIELARRVVARTGSSSRLRQVSYEEAYGEGFEELGDRRPDCSELKRLTGWKPERSIDDAIDDAIAFELARLSEPAEATAPRGTPPQPNGLRRESIRSAERSG